jgi:hypothetical protein
MVRDPGFVGQRVLENVVHTTAGTPDQTARIPPPIRDMRTALALDAPHGGGVLAVVAAVFLVMCITPMKALLDDTGRPGAEGTAAMLYGVVGVSVVAFVGLFIYSLVRRRRMLVLRRARLAEATAWPARQPFSVTGFSSWLVADQPLLDLHLTGPIDQAMLARALQQIDAGITLEVVDERTMRIAVPPRQLQLQHRRIPYGNLPLLNRVFAELILPLHGDGAVTRVTMGGLASA